MSYPSSSSNAQAILRTVQTSIRASSRVTPLSRRSLSTRSPISSFSSTPSSSAISRPIRQPLQVQQARRTFFSLPDLTKLASLVPGQDGVEGDGEQQKFYARKILPYSQAQLYSLIADVPSYSSFIPFCTSSTVLHPPSADGHAPQKWSDWKPGSEPFEVRAELAVGFGGLEERYVSKVVGKPFESVTATASNQTPIFKSLITTWSFTPASSLSPHPSTSSAHTQSPSTTRLPNSTAPTDPNVGPTLLTIDLAFAFLNPLHRIASQAVLPKVADKMVEAFEKRCMEVWGKGTQ
ncbi:hypothetical protein CI109_107067 [Kwoniella shandongensis]|uniref:Uncharacterized protein n=1 Tax=Kwoniella shandongensis TaxID=1734106 RepID=A0A5M6BR21_9TREE|nr:uncharacterized protein CI109_006476 [Kwoniella shandongensis]KAA5525207.1 hypothetical protein CI109_006476 [Kwoniella shandongensis]